MYGAARGFVNAAGKSYITVLPPSASLPLHVRVWFADAGIIEVRPTASNFLQYTHLPQDLKSPHSVRFGLGSC